MRPSHYAALLGVSLRCTMMLSQYADVTLRILNGKTGKPLSGYRVYLAFDGKTYEVDQVTNGDGIIHFSPKSREKMRVIVVGTKSCAAEEIGDAQHIYSVSETISHGYVTRDTCGDQKPARAVGEIVYYAKPASSWELLKN